MKKFLAGFVFCFFVFGLAPFLPASVDTAGAAVKKDAKKAAKPAPKTKIKKSAKKAAKKTAKVKKTKKTKKVKKATAAKPAAKVISVKFLVEEGADEAEGQNLVDELKEMGALDASFNVENNILLVKTNPAKLAAGKIVAALKDLGYTLKTQK